MPYAKNQYSEPACETEEVAHAHVKVLALSFITCCLSSKLLHRVCYISCLLCFASTAINLLSHWEGNGTKREVGFIFLLFLIYHQKSFEF